MSLEQVLETRRSTRKIAWALVVLVAALVIGAGVWLLAQRPEHAVATGELVDPVQIMAHGKPLPVQQMTDFSVVYP